MALLRNETQNNFTIIGNYILQSRNVSLKAIGMYSKIASLPDNWRFTEEGLATICKDGKAAVKSALKELEDLNLLFRFRKREENGELGESIYYISSTPMTDEEKTQIMGRYFPLDIVKTVETLENTELEPKADFPTMENPTMDNPTMENQQQLNTNILNTKKLNTNILNTNILNNNNNNKSCAKAPDRYVIDLPTNKFNTSKENYYVTDEFYKTMVEIYPNVNVLDELKKMKGWLLTNTAKRKTLKGMEKFINGWLSRQQDQAKPSTSTKQNSTIDWKEWDKKNNNKQSNVDINDMIEKGEIF